jgi:hypothetical protein
MVNLRQIIKASTGALLSCNAQVATLEPWSQDSDLHHELRDDAGACGSVPFSQPHNHVVCLHSIHNHSVIAMSKAKYGVEEEATIHRVRDEMQQALTV